MSRSCLARIQAGDVICLALRGTSFVSGDTYHDTVRYYPVISVMDGIPRVLSYYSVGASFSFRKDNFRAIVRIKKRTQFATCEVR